MAALSGTLFRLCLFAGNLDRIKRETLHQIFEDAEADAHSLRPPNFAEARHPTRDRAQAPYDVGDLLRNYRKNIVSFED